MIAGIVPLLIDNFMIILISRAMLGFGVGLFNSLLVSMINYFYDAKERSSMYGLQSAFEGAGGIAITFIAGQLLKANGGDQIKKESHKSAGFLPVVYYVGLIFMAAMLYMIMGIKIASLMTGEGYGTASDASLVIILLSLGGISAGLLFGKILKVFNQLTTSIGLIILALAMVILGLSQNLVITFVGGYLTGFGFKIFMPSLIDKINNSNIPNTTLATSLLLVGFNLGVFISPYGSIVIQSLMRTEALPALFIANAIGFISLSTITLIITLIKNKKTVNIVQKVLE